MLSIIRQDKKLLFGLIGFVSGMLGALIADILTFTLPDAQPYIIGIISVAVWAGLFSAIIATGLYWAIDVYGHRKTSWPVLLTKSIPIGFIAGAVSGGIAQAIYGPFSMALSDTWVHFLFQSACWGLAGLILGWGLSRAIPNMGAQRAVIAGAIGGLIGGAGFLIASDFLTATPGRMLGVGILGASLGLCLIIVEERYRTAYIEVHWAPNEVSKFTLGSIPIYIGGGGEDDIYVHGLQHHAMSLVSERGKVTGIYKVTGEQKELSNGSSIKFGKVEMIVRMNR